MAQIKRNKAFTFAEALVIILVVSFFLTSLVWFTASTSTDTAKTAHYLRALILAQEAIDIINAIPERMLEKSSVLSALEGSLTDPNSLKSIKMPVDKMQNSDKTEIAYPDSYSPAYFYREIVLGNKPSGEGKDACLREVTVNIYWNEGKAPKNINKPERMRKLSIATLALDEKKFF